MTPNQAKELLPIITAFAEGKTLQLKMYESNDWSDCTNLDFRHESKMYRIKPEPRKVYGVEGSIGLSYSKLEIEHVYSGRQIITFIEQISSS